MTIEVAGADLASWLGIDRPIDPAALPKALRRGLAEAAIRDGAPAVALALAGLDAEGVWAIDVRTAALTALGRPAEAIAAIAGRAEDGPIVARRLLALAHLATGDAAAAAAIADRLVADLPDAVTSWCTQGEIALGAGDGEAARAAYARALDLSPASSMALTGLARAHLAAGDPAGARALIEPRLTEGGSSLRPVWADCLAAAGDPRAAAEWAALDETRRRALDTWRAKVLAAIERFDAAIETAASGPSAGDRAAPDDADLVTPIDDGAPAPELLAALREAFGLVEFRPGQVAVCNAMIDGRDTLAIMPTGAGKSLCFQLPSLLLDGVTLVISPLVALMKDQIDGLPPPVYPKATLINATLDPAEVSRRLIQIAAGRYKLIYVAPERLSQAAFLQAIQQAGVARVVIDEAHCVSAWGHDFRPDYLTIGRILGRIGNPPILALTATAPRTVREDIARQLGRDLATLQTPLFRPNLRYEVVATRNAEEKTRILIALCHQDPGSTIVYVNSRQRVEDLARTLNQRGIRAAHYHAGLEPEIRSRVQDDFMLDRIRVIVATVAFGMGVDKANVRQVVHFSLPESLEAYVQESGRAGRDGRPARCVLLYGAGDKANLTRWLRAGRVDLDDLREVYRQIRQRLGIGRPGWLDDRTLTLPGPDEEAQTRIRVAISLLERCDLLRRSPDDTRQFEVPRPPTDAATRLESLLADYAAFQDRRVEDMVGYVERQGCRHAWIARHFGQRVDPPCGACDWCAAIGDRGRARPAATTTADRPATAAGIAPAQPAPRSGDSAAPTPAAAILAGLAAAPFPLGKKGLIRVLTGSVSAHRDADQNPSFGVLADRSPSALEKIIDRLLAEGYLERATVRELPVLIVTERGRQGPPEWDARIPTATRPAAASIPDVSPARLPTASAAPASGPAAEDRFERLRAWRRQIATAQNVPPFFILSDTTLRAIAALPPENLDLDRLGRLPGIGETKLSRHGREILDLLRSESDANGD